MKDVLILFSGGKDSFLSTLIMLNKGYRVNLVTFDNGQELKSKNVLIGAKKIKNKFGEDKVNIIGIKKTDAIFRELICSFYNYDTNYINQKFGNITISQFNCLACRLSMYILSIIICKKENVKLVVDGARKSQLFAIEQQTMINEFKKLFENFNLEIIFPVLNETYDYSIKNQILANGFVPKMNECQCLLGMPILNGSMNDDILEGCLNVYMKELYPKIERIIETYKNIDFKEKYL